MRIRPVESIFGSINTILLVLFTFSCFYPFYYIFIYSVSNPAEVTKGVYFVPAGFTLINYISIFSVNNIMGAALVSASRAVIGTIITVICSSLFAYIVTKKELRFRSFIYRFMIVTMYINSGLIPWYMTMKYLGLKNNFLLYILPSAIGAFYVILVKTYIEQIPAAFEESAMIDGAGYVTIFFKIIFPVCMPIIATIAIFSAVSQWNSWQDNFFLVSNNKLRTLQLVLLTYLNGRVSQSTANMSNLLSARNRAQSVTPTSIRMTISVIAMLPIIIVYPAMQKYFAKGIMMGAVKG